MTNELLTPAEARAKLTKLLAKAEAIVTQLQTAKRQYHADSSKITVSIPTLLKEKRELDGRIIALRQYVEGSN